MSNCNFSLHLCFPHALLISFLLFSPKVSPDFTKKFSSCSSFTKIYLKGISKNHSSMSKAYNLFSHLLMKTSQNVSYFSQVQSSIEVLFMSDPLEVYGVFFLTSALCSYFSSKFSLGSFHLYHSYQQSLHLSFVLQHQLCLWRTAGFYSK